MYSKIDWYIWDSFITSSYTVCLFNNFFIDFIKVCEHFTLGMQEFPILYKSNNISNPPIYLLKLKLKKDFRF